MPTLSTKFTLQDSMSKKLQQIAKAGKDVKQSLDSICTVTDDLEDVSSKVDDNEKAFEQLSQKISKNSECTKKFDDAVKSNKSSMDELKSKTKSTSSETDKFSTSTTKAKTETDKLGKGLKDNKEPLDQFKEKVKDTGKETDGLGDKISDTMETIGTAIASVGLIAFFDSVIDKMGECIDLSSKFETAIAKTSTLTVGTGYNQTDIKSDMTSLSMDTGKSTEELSEAQYQALSAGVAADESAKFVEKANALAVGGFTQTDTAVDIMTTAINAYNLSVKDATSITDDLIMTQNLGKTTVNELASNMGRVIPTAAAYNLDLQDLSTSYAVLTASGIATAESTTYLNSMINELGDSGSDVSKSLQDETGQSFKEMMDSGKSLGDVVNALSKSVDNDSTAFANLWSSQEAGKAGLALLNAGTKKYDDTLNKMVNSTGSATSAYETMSNTSEHTTETFKNSADNFKKSVGDSLIPTTDKFKKAGAEVLNHLTTFVKDNPQVVSAVTSLGVGIGIVTTAVIAYNTVTKLAKIVTTAFTAVMDTNPMFLAGTALAAVVAGLTAYNSLADDAKDNTEQLSLATTKQKDKLDELNDKLEKTEKKYGDNSYQAEELKHKINKLEDAYSSSKQTLDEWIDSCNQVVDNYNDTMSSHKDNIEKIESEDTVTKNLVSRLSKLGSQSKITASDQAEMSSIIDILNEKVPSLGLTYSKVSNDIKGSVKDINSTINKELFEDKYTEYYNSWKDAASNKDTLKNKLSEAKEQLRDAKDRMEEYNDSVSKTAKKINSYTADGEYGYLEASYYSGTTSAEKAKDEFEKKYKEIQDTYDKAKSAYDNNINDIKEYQKKIKELKATELGLNLNTKNSTQKGINEAATTIKSDLDSLAESYDKAYESAYKSFSEQYKMWDKVKKVSATSTDKISSNLQSQINYWDTYKSNLDTLNGYTSKVKGLSTVLKQLGDGSENSASILQGLANSVKNGDTSGLQDIVKKYGDLTKKQEQLSTSYADVQIGLDEAKDGLVKSAEDTIDKLNLSKDAKQSAKKTIDAYIDEITGNKNRIAGAMADAISGAKNLLIFNDNNSGSNNKNKKKNTTEFVAGTNGNWFNFDSKDPFNIKNTSKNAIGTDYAKDIFLAGEEGPELVVGQKGAKVYTAQETRNLLYGDDKKIAPNFSINTSQSSNSTNNSNSSSADKTVTIKLEGIGSIKVVGANKNTNKEDIVNVMTQNLKPVLINILNEEIFEEGDDSYEF